MQTISYTEARGHFAKIMNQICEDHAPIMVTRQKSEAVVMMSLQDYESILETVYLLRSPKNAMRLKEALDEIEKEGGTVHTLLDDEYR